METLDVNLGGDDDPRFAQTAYIVEADSFARQTLWEQWSDDSVGSASKRGCNTSRFKWEQDPIGFMKIIGHLSDRPVNVEVFFSKLNGMTVAFWDCVSMVCDWEMAREWIHAKCPGAQGHCDANNFHQCANEIRKLTEIAEVQES